MTLRRLLIPVLFLLLPFCSTAQSDSLAAGAATKPAEPSSGFQLIPKLGLGFSRNFLADLGLIAFSYVPDKNKARYFDMNLGVTGLFGRHTMMMPRLDLQAGLFTLDKEALFCFNVGADAGLLTDFRNSRIMISPKAGLSFATGLIRLNYLYNILAGDKTLFPGFGRHGVMLEVNISVLQGKGFKTM